MNRAELVAKWEERAKELRRLHAHVDGAVLCEEALKDFTEVLESEERELLSLRDAAALSGYSEDHLSRLIRDGTVPNAGRRGAPRVRRGDLPKRAGSRVAASRAGTYDPVADARKLGNRRKGGAHGTS